MIEDCLASIGFADEVMVGTRSVRIGHRRPKRDLLVALTLARSGKLESFKQVRDLLRTLL